MVASLVAQSVKRQEDPLEKEIATHSSTLAWKIPWTEEPGRLSVHEVTKSRTRLSDFTSLLDGKTCNILWFCFSFFFFFVFLFNLCFQL